MKKGIIVLLITVLAAGMVFAEDVQISVAPTLKGSFNTEFGYDLDGNHDFGFNAENKRASIKAEFKFSFKTISKDASSKGEVLPYAEVEATASVKADDVKLSKSDKYEHNLKISAKVTKANIVGEGWTIDLLGAKAGSDYAVAAIDERIVERKPYYLDFVYAFDKADGVTVTVDKYGTVGVGLTGNKDAVNASIFAETAADLLKFDEFGLQFAGTFTVKGEAKKAGASAKATYEAEKLSAKIAADFGYAADKFNTDIAAFAKYDQEEFGLTFDAYYATFAETAKASRTEVNYLGAQLVADIKAIKTDVTVQAFDLLDDPEDAYIAKGLKTLNVIAHNNYVEGLDITVSGLDLINDARDVSVEATITMIEKLSLSVYGNELINVQNLGFGATYTGVEKFTFAAGADYTITSKVLAVYGQVDYEAEKFSAYARADFSKTMDAEDAKLGLSAGITSTKLVDNATLSLIWAAVDPDTGMATNDVLNKEYGKITASCTIAF